jgi:hypothetical protein
MGQMNRRRFLTGLAAIGMAGPAFAQSPGDDIARQLGRLGYSDIRVTRTLLGRFRVVAEKGNRRREIIVNPGSGEILRDLVTDARTGATSSPMLDDDSDSGSNRGRDDDDNDGRSGSGGRNSGSGGGDGGGGGSSGGSGSGGSEGGGGGGDDGGDDD